MTYLILIHLNLIKTKIKKNLWPLPLPHQVLGGIEMHWIQKCKRYPCIPPENNSSPKPIVDPCCTFCNANESHKDQTQPSIKDLCLSKWIEIRMRNRNGSLHLPWDQTARAKSAAIGSDWLCAYAAVIYTECPFVSNNFPNFAILNR